MSYVTAEELREWRNITPEEFGLEAENDPETALNALLDKWAGHIKDLIDDDRGRDFLDEAGGDPAEVSGSVKTVALRALSNYVTLAQAAREATMVRLDEWRVSVEQHDQVLTRTLKAELPRRAPGLSMLTTEKPDTST